MSINFFDSLAGTVFHFEVFITFNAFSISF
jgi:hypothetical protein